MDIGETLFRLQVEVEGKELIDCHSSEWEEGFLAGCQFMTDYVKDRIGAKTTGGEGQEPMPKGEVQN